LKSANATEDADCHPHSLEEITAARYDDDIVAVSTLSSGCFEVESAMKVGARCGVHRIPTLTDSCLDCLRHYLQDLLESRPSCNGDDVVDLLLSWPNQLTTILQEELLQVLACQCRLSIQAFDKLLSSEIAVVNLSCWRSTLINNYFRSSDYNSQCWYQVVDLNLSSVDIITDDEIFVVTRMFPNLTALDISNCDLLTHTAVHLITESESYRRTLRKLDISFISLDAASVESLPHLTALVEMRMTRCLPAFVSLEDVPQFMFPHLTVLDIGRNSTMEGTTVDAWVGQHIYQLVELNLTESQCSADAFISACRNSDRLQENEGFLLETINLSWCDNIDLTALEIVAHQCHHLKFAYLRNSLVDSACLCKLAENNISLLELYVPRCDDLDDTAAVAVANHCRRLHVLDISWAFVTDVGFMALITNCTKLQVLLVKGCKHLTAELVEWLLSEPTAKEGVGSEIVDTADIMIAETVAAADQSDQKDTIIAKSNLHCLDFGWVNMFNKQMAVQLSRAKAGLYVLDYYNEVHLDGIVVAEFL
jgi:hypothetical protein